jgi:hypothetical protein
VKETDSERDIETERERERDGVAERQRNRKTGKISKASQTSKTG